VFRKRTNVQHGEEGQRFEQALLGHVVLKYWSEPAYWPWSSRWKRRAFISNRANLARRHRDRGTQRKRDVDGLLDTPAHILGIVARMDFDLHFKVPHFLPRLHPNLEFSRSSQWFNALLS